MSNDPRDEIRHLLDRLVRLAAADEWTADLNPPQYAALAYLARANRFSRAPSQVAEYLSSTRGTVSQTLKALLRKGYIAETRSQSDRRSISYVATESGLDVLRQAVLFEAPLGDLSKDESGQLADSMRLLLRRVLERRGNRTFGLCRACMHHQKSADGLYCALLQIDLKKSEAGKICHEHVSRRSEGAPVARA